MLKKGLTPKKSTENRGEYINVTLFKGIAVVCASRKERVKLQEGSESRSPVTYLETIPAFCISSSSQPVTHQISGLNSFSDVLLRVLDQTTPDFW